MIPKPIFCGQKLPLPPATLHAPAGYWMMRTVKVPAIISYTVKPVFYRKTITLRCSTTPLAQITCPGKSIPALSNATGNWGITKRLISGHAGNAAYKKVHFPWFSTFISLLPLVNARKIW